MNCCPSNLLSGSTLPPFPVWIRHCVIVYIFWVWSWDIGSVAVVGKMTTFDLWPRPLGGGAWGAGTNMWHPETPASYELLPAPLATQFPTLWMLTSGGRGRGGALILDRCRAFDLFASVDAHLWSVGDHILQEFNALYVTRLRTYKIATHPIYRLTF